MKIYMAGPLFSTAELAFNAALASELRRRGHEVCLPRSTSSGKICLARSSKATSGVLTGPRWWWRAGTDRIRIRERAGS